MSARFGYLVPEFPAQTHAFFWREIAELRRLGADPVLISTSRPTRSLESHRWAAEAVARTTYLRRAPARVWAAAATVLLLAVVRRRLGPTLAALRSGPEGPAEKVRLLVGGTLLAGAARAGRWTHVHVHSCASSAHLALVARHLSGLRYSLTLHGPLGDYGPRQPEKWREAAFVLVITRRLRDEAARQLHGSLPPVVELAPMGIRTDDLTREAPYEPWVGGEALVFSCGRLNRAKGHDTLVRAVARLRDQGLPVRLRIAGEDDDGGSGYRRILEREIAAAQATGEVSLLGAVDQDVVRRELGRAHVFVLASHDEPLGVAIMEAMAMAVPVVVGDGGGVRELVVDGECGLLVDPDDVDAIAGAVRRVLADRELAARLGAAGRERVAAGFDSRRGAETLLALVERSAERGGGF